MAYIAGTKNPIDTGDSYFQEINHSAISGHYALKRDGISKLPIADEEPLEARIEHARWIVDCPNCNGAEFAFEDGLFLCSLCKNSNIEGKVRRVKFPKERKQIEGFLTKRPIKNRNWEPGETIDNLEKQNHSHGIGGDSK